MKFSLLAIATGFLVTIVSCRTTPQLGTSELATSERVTSIPALELKDLPFEFCPLKHSFSLNNALWLTYLATEQYSHFGIFGPELGRLGFGSPGEGDAYFKGWYILRIKRILEKKSDTDDTWTNEDERKKRLELVQNEYKERFQEDYINDSLTADDYERLLVDTPSSSKIQFISGRPSPASRSSKISSFRKPTTQAVYAEHPSLDFAVLSIRGTEFDESIDLLTDANIAHTSFESMGNVETGFYSAYKEVEDRILSLLRSKSSLKPINLWVTGHSLGAAVSTLLSAKIMWLHERGDLKNVHLVGSYNMGSPRIGDHTFAQAFDAMSIKQNVTFVRIRNRGDAVSRIPLADYWHVGALAYFGKDNILYYGDGWKTIEAKSDYLTSYIPSTADHKILAYWASLKKTYFEHKKDEVANCSLIEPNTPPALFYEDTDDRKGH
ncbi:MAG: lipase family protein [Chitinophagaceae bacterium]|nr:lipase family protein [Oligoflexus sp.]